ncbi:MAG TPA: hypothetical protein PKL97_01750 [Candidatus Omnitrophota bacterium]|nr:hypothetical protein [Candidatus Omnitrophota bacterium]
MKKFISLLIIAALIFGALPGQVFAENTAVHGKITGKTAIYGLCSLLLWPGIGQYLNDNEEKKIVTHALLGLTGIFRLWSGWDALIDRKGGRWDGKI